MLSIVTFIPDFSFPLPVRLISCKLAQLFVFTINLNPFSKVELMARITFYPLARSR
jgi:hypothetical protein